MSPDLCEYNLSRDRNIINRATPKEYALPNEGSRSFKAENRIENERFASIRSERLTAKGRRRKLTKARVNSIKPIIPIERDE